MLEDPDKSQSLIKYKRNSNKRSLASPKFDVLAPREVKFERVIKNTPEVNDYASGMELKTRFRLSESRRRH